MLGSKFNDVELRQQLVQIYEQLPLIDKQMVRLFSVIYEPVGRTVFLNCVNALGLKQSNGKPFHVGTLKPHLDALIKKEMIVAESGSNLMCHSLLTEIATRDAVMAGEWEKMVEVVQDNIPVSTISYGRREITKFQNSDRLFRQIRIGIYRQDFAYIEQQLEDYYYLTYNPEPISMADLDDAIFSNPFDPYWFDRLPQFFYETGLYYILRTSMGQLMPKEEAWALLQGEANKVNGGRCSDDLRLLIVEQLILRDDFKEAKFYLKQIESEISQMFWGWLAFLEGDNDKAIACYTKALKELRKVTGKKQIYFQNVAGIFFIFALLKDGSAQGLQEAERYAKIAISYDNGLSYTYIWLEKLIQFQQGNIAIKEWFKLASIFTEENYNSIEILCCSLCLYWVDPEEARYLAMSLLIPLAGKAEVAGYYWLGTEAAELGFRLQGNESVIEAINSQNNRLTLADLIQPKQDWEISLQVLANLQNKDGNKVQGPTEKRLAWFVELQGDRAIIHPREQKISKKGTWSKGRSISLKRLENTPSQFDCLTSQDLKVCSYIETQQQSSRYYYRGFNYYMSDRAILALVGHPFVFWEDSPYTRIEIVVGEPELIVKKNGERLILEFSPKIASDREIIAVKETPTKLKVIEITADHQRIGMVLGSRNRLEVPVSASEQVLAAISGVSPLVTVHSDIGGDLEAAKEVPANTQPHIHLLPAGEGLKVALLCRPFGEVGSYYRPGKGGSTVIAEIEGERLQTTRNLKTEQKQANRVIDGSTILTRYDAQDGEWLIEDPEDCLQLLLELQELGENVTVEWPEGEKLRISHQADLKQFQMQIKGQKDWFEASGELKLDNNLVLDLQKLMELLENTSSRFLPLGDNQFIALTQQFRQRLDELKNFGTKKGKGLQFHPIASLVLEDAIADVGKLQADKQWLAQVRKIKEMKDLQPELPSTLQAELRDYQREGFEWLSRLAYWGVGACLADQMGLGKTLQALALILTQAPDGPTLIIAPTSVCANWIDEAQKFAPTLNPVQFSQRDRQGTLDALQPFDLFVCSYGLLQQEDVAEMLAKVQWQTIVLDEAQAIKNMATKRSQAAMKLQGKFKLITTGTPIENHLGELWNLFRFINPGLLGSWEQFNQRFATPIERQQEIQVKKQLKKLIQPFLLRRTKTQVLSELPSRTEITLSVELSEAEAAFYEALRQNAIAKLADSEATAGTKHLQVLAEIMKLRRACCNSRLVMPESSLPSAKLEVFGEVLEELLENNHKALVFSQFVDHLHIIRDYLDEKQISYQYLDGSTPAKHRQTRINDFQSGKGDVFLISLKAGGTGLNLTAADYVIHMDPWWNPAVEDQASDRAHRLGQQRPVTIYRLVTQGTIEEKIVELHQHKRDLADSLLEGTEVSGKMSTDELLHLMTYH